MHEFRAGSAGEFRQHSIACLAVSDARAYLDEFVIVQGPSQFGRDALGQPALADQHDRMQRVAEAAEVFSLSVREGHRQIIGAESGS